MANDRLYEFNGQKGHWYTDEQGNRYFVAQGQTPKEGWEATKRRKMIKGGKYVKDDGDDKGEQEISANEYQTYEADEEERFDETTDADFEDPEPEGFDRDDDDERSWGPDQPEDEIWAKFDEWQKYAFSEDQTPENIEKGNKLSEEWSEGLYDYMTDDQKKEFERIYDTADPDELEKFVANVIGNRRNARGSDGTNGWKPSEEATSAYDVGGFYSINEGDRWEFEDGGFVEVRDIDGENVAVTTKKGTKRITKDELSDMVKNAVKAPGKGKSQSDKKEPTKKAESKNEEPKSSENIEKEVNSYKGGIEGVDDHIKDVCEKYGCRFITSNRINDDTVEVCIGGVTGNEWFKVKNTGSNANPHWYGSFKLVDYIKKSAEKSENTINTAFDYLKELYDDPDTRVFAIRKTVERFPNATNYEIGRVMEKLIEYSKGKK